MTTEIRPEGDEQKQHLIDIMRLDEETGLYANDKAQQEEWKQYISEPSIVEAEQFLPPRKVPQGVMNVYLMGSLGAFWYTGEVCTIQGEKVRVKSGEWIVREPLNPKRYYPVSDESFRAKYKPLPAPPPKENGEGEAANRITGEGDIEEVKKDYFIAGIMELNACFNSHDEQLQAEITRLKSKPTEQRWDSE